MPHSEHHRSHHIGWLRAQVLGANDGIVSTASLVLGVAGSGAVKSATVIAGLAGLVAGALSMAAGEYVSVSTQADTQDADLARERRELTAGLAQEHAELAGIYVARGLDPELAARVATQLMARDALAAHARDEIGITSFQRARPVQAALASAAAFAFGALLPLFSAVLTPAPLLAVAVPTTSLTALALLGGLAEWTGGASPAVDARRVVLWGTFAMAATHVAGRLVGTIL